MAGLPGDRNTLNHSMFLPLEVDNSFREDDRLVLGSIHLDQALHKISDLVPGVVVELQRRGNMLDGDNHTVTWQKFFIQWQTQVYTGTHRDHRHDRRGFTVVLETHCALVERRLGLAVVVDSRALELGVVLLDCSRNLVCIVVQIIKVLLFVDTI